MYYAPASDVPRFSTLKTKWVKCKRVAFARSLPHYIRTFRSYIYCTYIPISINTQRKCEQYWSEQLDKPYDAGRGFTVVNTGYRGIADYVVRDMTLKRVSLSKSMQSPQHCTQPGMNTYNIIMYYSISCNSYNMLLSLCAFSSVL